MDKARKTVGGKNRKKICEIELGCNRKDKHQTGCRWGIYLIILRICLPVKNLNERNNEVS